MIKENIILENVEFIVKQNEKNWKSIYKFGAIATIIGLIGIFADVIIGNITGGDLTTLPNTAIERFTQIHDNIWLGLYNLDFLNMINQIILIVSYFALFAAHRKINLGYSILAFVFFAIGTTIFIVNNAALPMIDITNKYFATADLNEKLIFAAAGETLLLKGAHGNYGTFLSFFIPNIGGLLISIVMLKGKIFSKTNSILGIIGSVLILIYVLLVTFFASTKTMATIIAMPGGILLMIWMIMFTIKLFKLSKEN